MFRSSRCIIFSRLFLSLFLVAVAFITIQPVRADSFPTIPETFYGNVKNNGTTVGAGYTVEARINGTAVTVVTTDSQGRYGYNTSSFTVTCSSGSVSLYVNGVLATTVSCTPGATKLDLSVTGAPSSYTAPTIASTTVTITTTSLPSGTVGTAYSATLSSSGGTSPYTWSLSSGNLPAGLTLNNGVISGTPTSAATSTFTIQATDSASNTAIETYSVTISTDGSSYSTLSISTSSLSNGTVGTSYVKTLAATGGSGSYIWTLTDGSLPDGVSLSSAGTISGTPTSSATYSFTVMATDSNSLNTSKTLSLYIASAATTTSSTTSSTSSSSSSGTPTSPSTGSSSSQSSATPSSAIAAFAISNMTATPISSKSGNQVNISINIANTSKVQGTKSLLLKINDNVEAQQDVVLDPGESQVVTFTVNKNTPGTYKASIDPLSADFVITSAPATQQSNDSGVPVVGIFIGGFLLVFLIILLIIRQRRQSNY